MIHTLIFTQAELSALKSFLILKDTGIYKIGDMVMITVRNDIKETEDQPADKSLTRQQTFFTVTEINNAETMRGIKAGFVMVSIKRTKNPVPKVSDELPAGILPVEED